MPPDPPPQNTYMYKLAQDFTGRDLALKTRRQGGVRGVFGTGVRKKSCIYMARAFSTMHTDDSTPHEDVPGRLVRSQVCRNASR